MSIRLKIEELREIVPSDVKIVAVSKFHSNGEIMEAYDAGQRIFGESRVQELVQKQQDLPEDIEWHFIGNLQRNKVKQIAPFVSLIHSLDSERLMREIEKQGSVNNRIIPCLLQIHIADEETKSGFSPEECRLFLSEGKWRECSHMKITGIMGMATFTEDENKVRKEFDQLKSLFDEFKDTHFKNDPDFKEVSMGMTGDYKLAIEAGSTIIRIGTLIFGNR
ncbi:MAG: YggS family pyridoxal phosphate-dependent enzyme [Fermentimonas sp.]|nr:YggS family pyridoxal phosphate-dependent enzyme [Fermentimonas sp.]MDD4008608.1 YggS family pyridoxal phosphate-dependent enzyme [Fermentimonas sp.]MDD4698279.1 YggS family pyridoxal phosphate-dependent enzyme [Fermentimonas sp.]